MRLYKPTILLLVISSVLFSAQEDLNLEQRFHQAKSLALENDFKKAFSEIYNDYPNSYYGQLSLLELAKHDILNRDYLEAVEKLRKINHPEIQSKEYWLANAYFKKDQYQEAIISAQNFIFDANEKDKIETSYFLIAESYIKQHYYSKALSTLEFLRNSEFIENSIPLLHFKIGYCNEMLGKYDQAIAAYKKLKIEYPYHQYSYQAENRIYKLSGEDNKISTKELQEFQEIEPELEITEKPDFTIEEKPQQEEPEETVPIKKSYLQVGAFSSRKNAISLADEIDGLIKVERIIFIKKLKGKDLHVLAYGPFSSESDLITVKNILKSSGYNSFKINRY